MYIAFLLNEECVLAGASNGIRKQALIWKRELERQGNQVALIDNWGNYVWRDFDIIHFYGAGSLCELIPTISRENPNIIISPIIDSNKPKWLYKIASFWGSKRLRLFSSNYYLRWVSPQVSMFLARTQYEYDFYHQSYGIDEDRIRIVPLSFREELSVPQIDLSEKEPFCLHVSLYTQPRKNCIRLAEAAIKYGFELVIAGNPGAPEDGKELRALCEGHSNIHLLGFLSDEELADLYRRAKVFALPSLMEGVGLVALEAAIHGCEIVLTRNGGPKEYYKGDAFLVDPMSVDSIGKAVLDAMNGTNQPALRERVLKNYNVSSCVNQLLEVYHEVSGK